MISGLTSACQTLDAGAWIVLVAFAVYLLFMLFSFFSRIRFIYIILIDFRDANITTSLPGGCYTQLSILLKGWEGAGKKLSENKNTPVGARFCLRGGRDSNPRWTEAHNGFRDRPIQPLWHIPNEVSRVSYSGVT